MPSKYEDILIFYDNSIEYFRSYFKSKGLCAEHIYKEAIIYSKIIKVIFKYFKFPQTYWYGDWKRDISPIKTVIFVAPRKESGIVKYLKKKNRSIRIIYWYWDPVFRTGMPSSELSNIAELWSFDPDDCKKYDMMFNTTFYFNDILLPPSEIQFDAVFLGINKGRKDKLQKLEDMLNKAGLHTYFHIVPDKSEGVKNVPGRISYQEYLTLLSKSKAIIDVNPVGQSGLTLRPMESIFFKKKLITNDISIMSQDFYNPINIFIIGRDKEEYLKEFIDSPYIELDHLMVESYDVSKWVERFNLK